jgi:PEP-CTERM motif
MKTNLAKCVCGLLLTGAAATAMAQSTWNYFISDAGGGNSLVTWSVTGSLATSPGGVLLISESSLAVSIAAPGIYADAYAASGTPQAIPTLDGSYFQYEPASVYVPITLYYTDNAPSNGNDGFGLITPLLPRTGPGTELLYNPGTQSALIPVDFSNFNPGTYQSEESGFNTVLTVNLTVVPEPSTLALAGCAAIGAALTRRKNRPNDP